MKEREAKPDGEDGNGQRTQKAPPGSVPGTASGETDAENKDAENNAEAKETIGNTYDTVRPAPGRDDPSLDPYEIDFLPEFRGGKRGPEAPFVNDYGVVIGDHDYESPDSPLQQWSRNTEPSVMAGEQWVHPYKDIGFRTRENRDLFEKGVPPGPGMFTHPSWQTTRHEGSKTAPRRGGSRTDKDNFAPDAAPDFAPEGESASENFSASGDEPTPENLSPSGSGDEPGDDPAP